MRLPIPHRIGALGLLAIGLAAGSPSPGVAFPSTDDAAVVPREWAQLALAHCREAEEQTERDDQVLAETLATAPVSREQASFLEREREARATARDRGRRATLGRLNAALYGDSALFQTRGSAGEQTFLEVMQALLRREDVCAVDAIEGTVLLGVLGVPLTVAASRQLRPDREVHLLNAAVSEQSSGGATLGQVFERMRPESPHLLLDYVAQVTREAIRQSQKPATTHEDLGPAVERRVAQFLELVSLASEPL